MKTDFAILLKYSILFIIIFAVSSIVNAGFDFNSAGFPINRKTQVNSSVTLFNDSAFIIVDTLHFNTDTILDTFPMAGQLSKDGTEFYFSLGDAWLTSHKLFYLERNNPNQSFNSDSIKLLIDTVKLDSSFNVTVMPTAASDKTTYIFVNTLEFWSNNDLYIGYRSSSSSLIDSVRLLSEICDTGRGEAYPWLSPSGLALYFTRGYGFHQDSLFVSRRSSVDDTFGPAVPLNVNNELGNLACWLTDDEREIYFSRRNGSDDFMTTLYYAKRSDGTGPFSKPVPVFRLDTTFISGFSRIGDEAYIWSDKFGWQYLFRLEAFHAIGINSHPWNRTNYANREKNLMDLYRYHDAVYLYNLRGQKVPFTPGKNVPCFKLPNGILLIRLNEYIYKRFSVK